MGSTGSGVAVDAPTVTSTRSSGCSCNAPVVVLKPDGEVRRRAEGGGCAPPMRSTAESTETATAPVRAARSGDERRDLQGARCCCALSVSKDSPPARVAPSPATFPAWNSRAWQQPYIMQGG